MKNIFLLLIISAFLGCKKYKKPTVVEFQAKVSNTTVMNDQLTFSDVLISVAEFEFSGERKKGEDVDFEKEFTEGALLSFNPSSSVNSLRFDIPQGSYTRVEVRLDLDKNDNNYSLLLQGNYINLSGDLLAVRFELSDSQVFEWKGKDTENDNEILLDAEKTSFAQFSFNVGYWFGAISNSLFENATISEINGVNTIVISKNDNESIYDLVINRIDDSNELIFNQ